MIKVLSKWYHRNFSDPEAVLLVVILLLGVGLIVFFGSILAPVFASVVIAYFLQWWVTYFEKWKIPRRLSYLLAYLGFLAIFVMALLLLLPLIWKQVITLFNDLPQMVQTAKAQLLHLMDQYPTFLSKQQIDIFTSAALRSAQDWGKVVLSVSLSSIPGIITWAIYLILVPLLVFFFLKDRAKLTDWFVHFLPQKKSLLTTVWQEVDNQIGNYIRGKVLEIIIVGFTTYLVFLYFGLRYSVLLSVLVGLSVVIPYVGAAVVTIPVILVGYLQWGWDTQLGYMAFWYALVQFLDGNVLVPLLFSEAVNLHPVAIIVAILFFGAAWGFWGVFFAIPLATVVKAVLNSWPQQKLSN